ncbi:MAG: hypothetical protein KME50_00040 [Nostoc desertorum CM1-VF14]|jgi:hypothetical protein|nr:hypothetical protein [Nostoc desertorum CM1-VF14]
MVSIVTPDFAVGLLDFSQDLTGDNGQNLFNNAEITDLSVGLPDFSQDLTGDNGQNLFNNAEITDLSVGLPDFSQDLTGDNGQNLFNNAEITDLSIGLPDFSQDLTGDDGQNLFNNAEIIDLVGSFRDNTQYLTGDVDRDGDADLIEVWQDGGVFKSTSLINDGLGSFNSSVITDSVGDFRDNTQYVTGDVNRDGATDLIELWEDGGVFKSTSWINDGQGLFNSPVITDSVGSFRDNTQYVTGDVDRDDDADLIEVWQDGGVFNATNWINDGLGSFNIVSINFVGGFRDNTQYVTGDVDRDGDADLIEVWQDGGVFNATNWINNGLGSFNIGSINFVGDFRDNTQYVTGDVNQDGAADLIEVWQDGGVFNATNWINNGLGSFNIGSIDFVGDFLGTPIPLI